MTRKQEDKAISAIYRTHCVNRQIEMMRIGELVEMARTALRAGETPDQIGARMVAFIEGGR